MPPAGRINCLKQGPQAVDIGKISNLRTMRMFLTLMAWGLLLSRSAAQVDYTVICVAFYNVENLFDTLDSPDTDDLEFTPQGANLYTGAIYMEKQARLARVISEIGREITPDGPALLGVSEIENRDVLEDLVRQPDIAGRDYRILHQDSRDGRGVDVALLYQPAYFRPEKVIYYPLPIRQTDDTTVSYSRDILTAVGTLLGERVAISVGHWPSRRGGEQTTAHLRQAAASYTSHLLDSLAAHEGITKSIVMGDLNDDPINDSVRKHLRAQSRADRMVAKDRFNPFETFYRKGYGTTAYQDAWSLFDQIILSYDMTVSRDGLRFYKAGVFNPAYLTQRSGAFKGYPLRTYAGGSYLGGYSDHFPVYVLLVKPRP